MMNNEITKEYIISRIADVEFIMRDMATMCVMKFDNKFLQVGVAVCANPENYSEEMGKLSAYNDAVMKSFPHFNFYLKEDHMQNA